MKSKMILAKAIGSVLVGGLLMGSVTSAVDLKVQATTKFGQQATQSNEEQKAKCKKCKEKGFFFKEKRNLFQQTLNEMQKEGTISKEKINEINAYMEKKQKAKEARIKEFKKLSPKERKALFNKKFDKHRLKNNEYKPYILGELVKDKIITQKQAADFSNKYQGIISAKHQERITLSLKDLVNQKVITQDQAGKIAKEFDNFYQEKIALKEKLRGKSKEEIKDYFKNNKKEFKSPIAKLVENKVITEEQARKINEELISNHKKFNSQKMNRTIIKMNSIKQSRVL